MLAHMISLDSTSVITSSLLGITFYNDQLETSSCIASYSSTITYSLSTIFMCVVIRVSYLHQALLYRFRTTHCSFLRHHNTTLTSRTKKMMMVITYQRVLKSGYKNIFEGDDSSCHEH